MAVDCCPQQRNISSNAAAVLPDTVILWDSSLHISQLTLRLDSNSCLCSPLLSLIANWNFSTYPTRYLKKVVGFVVWFFFEKMRIFVAFEGSFEPFEVSADATVKAVKLMIKVCTRPLSH